MSRAHGLTIADPILEDDVAYELVPNGPEVPDAVDRLVEAGTKLPEPGTEREEDEEPGPDESEAIGNHEAARRAVHITGCLDDSELEF